MFCVPVQHFIIYHHHIRLPFGSLHFGGKLHVVCPSFYLDECMYKLVVSAMLAYDTKIQQLDIMDVHLLSWVRSPAQDFSLLKSVCVYTLDLLTELCLNPICAHKPTLSCAPFIHNVHCKALCAELHMLATVPEPINCYS